MFAQSLLSHLSPWHLLKHPFYQAWMKGELSLPQLRQYAVQYYPHVLAFPRYISATHSLCSDVEMRKALALNLSDEEGLATQEPHPELWLRFAEGVGLTCDEVQTAQSNAKAQALCDGFWLLSRKSYEDGLAALFAYEYQVPEIAKTKIEGLKRHYGVQDSKTLQFFTVHEEADVFHTETCMSALNRLPAHTHPQVVDSAITASKLLWDFLSEAYAYS